MRWAADAAFSFHSLSMGVVLSLSLSAHARTPTLEALFPESEVRPGPESAERAVRSAFDALFGFEGIVDVESVTRTAGGRTERVRFRLHRKRFERDVRVMLAT